MIDSHVHVGWFVDRYHAPDEITIALREVGIDTIAVSSTSTCAEEYDYVINEMLWFQEEWGEHVFPFLWITPQMIRTEGINKLLSAGIKWRGLKMHWQANPEFCYNSRLLHQVMAHVDLLNLPILLHTGEFPECHASVFESLLEQFHSRTFILAHGRPLNETEKLLEKFRNIYVDTAFMPIENVLYLIKKGLSTKILWGSDCPINEHFYPKVSTPEYLKSQLSNFRKEISKHIFLQITDHNFRKIYSP